MTTDSNAVSSVYIYIYSDNLSNTDIENMLGIQSKKLTPWSKKKWQWNSKWLLSDNPAMALDQYFENEYLKMQPALSEIVKRKDSNIRFQLVVGLGESIDNGVFPILKFKNQTLAALANSKMDFEVHVDEQISPVQLKMKTE